MKNEPITPAENDARQSRVEVIGRLFGFVGAVEYRHLATRSGGAQYRAGTTVEQDALIVYPEAFRRDAAGDDFSLVAIIAHERGHQLLRRHDQLLQYIAKEPSPAAEEILASLLGSLVATDSTDRELLFSKAVAELLDSNLHSAEALRLAIDLRSDLEKIL